RRAHAPGTDDHDLPRLHLALLAQCAVVGATKVVSPPSIKSSLPVVKVASNARNSAARAASSSVAIRFMGVSASPSRRNAARSSGEAPYNPIVGVSTKPGLSAFTRMLRGNSSAASTRAKARIAALLPEYTLIPG